MIRFLGILSVILFWIIALTLSPIILILGVTIFIIAIFGAISSLVYDLVTNYLEKKQ
jgi:uncharacterized protein involved in cysteine biosynthesis